MAKPALQDVTARASQRPTVTAVVTAHDRRHYWIEALHSADRAGADEIVLVRNFDDPIPPGLARVRDVRETASEAGVKEAVGVETATGDLVAFLDDDDRWTPDKVEWVREIRSTRPELRYLCHGQTPIDAAGRPAAAHHPEWARVHREGAPVTRSTQEELYSAAHEKHWPGNNSSTVIDRRWALGWTPRLREAGWGCDTFWLVACYADEVAGWLTTETHTELRLHTENMSQTRGSDAAEFRRRHLQMAQRFARALAVMVRAVQLRPIDPIRTDVLRSLEHELAGWELFRQLEAGQLGRSSALRALGRGLPRGASRTAAIALISPSLAREALYRSSRRRWNL